MTEFLFEHTLTKVIKVEKFVKNREEYNMPKINYQEINDIKQQVMAEIK